jgi:hypothetical protein
VVLISAESREIGFSFSGEVNWVEVYVDEATQNADQLFFPEESFCVGMARQ